MRVQLEVGILDIYGNCGKVLIPAVLDMDTVEEIEKNFRAFDVSSLTGMKINFIKEKE